MKASYFGVEQLARQKRRKGYLKQAVLATIAVAGIMLVTMAAPNALQLIGKISPKRLRRFNEEAQSALSRLAKQGSIVFEENNGKKYARITSAGKRVLEREAMRLRLEKKQRWDGRYRLILFDIKENRRKARTRLRTEMRTWGFLHFQDSVWLYPYDCEEIIALVKTELQLGREVVYAIVEEIENDAWIREHFRLRKR